MVDVLRRPERVGFWKWSRSKTCGVGKGFPMQVSVSVVVKMHRDKCVLRSHLMGLKYIDTHTYKSQL